jgi:hypothetical protein
VPADGLLDGLERNVWKTYEPELLAAANGAITPPSVGGGAHRGRYINYRGLVVCQIQTSMGASFVQGVGDCYVWSLPIPALRSWDGQIIGQGLNYHAVTGDAYNNPTVATLADTWTSLGGQEDSYLQLFQPYAMTKGTGTIATGTRTVTVTHNLGLTPAAYDIHVIPTTTAPSNSHIPYTISNIGPTTFDVTLFANSTGANWTFEWKCRVEPNNTATTPWLIGPLRPWPMGLLSDFFIQVYYEPQ